MSEIVYGVNRMKRIYCQHKINLSYLSLAGGVPLIESNSSRDQGPQPDRQIVTYFHWFRPPARRFASYSPIFLPLPAKLVRAFLRFRSGCSGLPIDTGRSRRVPRAARVCLACSVSSLCDEEHLVFECPALTSLRLQYAPLFNAGTVTMQTFLWQKDTIQVAQFVFAALSLLLSDTG